MNIHNLTSLKIYKNTIDPDSHRNNTIYILQNCVITGKTPYYPNCLLDNDDKLVIPYNETTMSFKKDSVSYSADYVHANQIKCSSTSHICNAYFFIYNFSNYYHFVYDTLPYLINYFYLKNIIPDIRLVINYPDKKRIFYKFTIDMLHFLGINDYILHENTNKYNNMFISSSLTHGGLSNLPPNKCVYNFFSQIKLSSVHRFKLEFGLNTAKKIYISRRTWTRQNNDNIGTDYTQRRKNLNEDSIVRILLSHGFTEIFMEDYTIEQKIQICRESDYIVGAIGGGMCNLLFTNSNVAVLCIVSPGFLEVNSRFKYCMDHTNITYFYDCYHETEPEIPLFSRAIVNDLSSMYHGRIAEILEYNSNTQLYMLNISNNDITGFNNGDLYNIDYYSKNQLLLLDNGLNSPYYIDETKFVTALRDFIK